MARGNGKLPRADLAKLATAKQPTQVVNLNGLGVSVEVRSLSVGEQLERGDLAEDESKRSAFMAEILHLACVDPEVSEEDAAGIVQNWPAGDVLTLFNAVMEVSGMAEGFQGE